MVEVQISFFRSQSGSGVQVSGDRSALVRLDSGVEVPGVDLL